jgi:hypothetical protein
MTAATRRTKVFVSYSHKDGIWLEELRPHLGALAREKGIDLLGRHANQGGSQWQDETPAPR